MRPRLCMPLLSGSIARSAATGTGAKLERRPNQDLISLPPVRSPSPSRQKGADQLGEDVVPTAAGEAGDREPESSGSQRARGEDADGAADEVREPERADAGARALQALHFP